MRVALRQVLFNIDPDAAAWRKAVLTAGGAVGHAQFSLVVTLIRSLKVSGVWTSLDRLWILASENATQALTDVKARAVATAQSSPTFTANRGYTFNGSSNYLETSFTPSTAGGVYTKDDASYGAWIVTAPTTTGGCEMGGEAGAPFSSMFLRFSAANHRVSINAGATADIAHNNNWTGDFQLQRTASNASELFRNGASVGTTSAADASLSSGTFLIGADRAPTPTAFSTAQIGMAWIGASMNAGKLAAFTAAKRAYMTSVGVP